MGDVMKLKRLHAITDRSPWLRRFPELAMIDDPDERGRMWKRAIKGQTWSQIGILSALIVALSIFIVVMNLIVLPKMDRWLGGHRIPTGVAGGIAGGMSAMLVMRLRRHKIERSLREQLVERGRAVCIPCGYDLQGQTQPRCPECGADCEPALISSISPGGHRETSADTTNRD